MAIVTGLAVYFVIWWLVLFAVLPWGSHSHHETDVETHPGNAPSAPVSARIGLKFAVTTVIATAIFAILFLIAWSGVIDLDSIPFLPKFEPYS